MALPMIVAVITIPMLIEGMGIERFGVLALIWVGVGYFSLFDLGLGRALTKLVAERLGSGELADLGPLVWSALGLLVLLGALGGAVVLLVAEPLVRGLLNVPPELQNESIVALRVLAVGIPVVALTAALIGLLEAHQRFAIIAAIRIPLGATTFIAPVVTLAFTPSLVVATTALVAARLLALVAYYLAALRARAELLSPCAPRRALLGSLLRFGGWLTVSNIVGPLLTYLDRFLVGAVLSMSAVTYYATPYEVLARTQLLPLAVMGVLFPAMTTALSQPRGSILVLYRHGTLVLLGAMLPLLAGLFLFAPEALEYWLGAEFRMAATGAAQWLALGVMLNVLGRPALTTLQSRGRPDLVAKTHLAELVPYLFLLWYCTTTFGIVGTAAAWSLRLLLDTLILNELVGRQRRELRDEVFLTRVRVCFITVGFGLAVLTDPLMQRVLVWLAVVSLSAWWLWPVLQQLRNIGSLRGNSASG